MGAMVRIVTAARMAAFAGIFAGMFSGANAQAQTAPSGIRIAQAAPDVTDDSAPRRRPLRRLPIYPRYQEEPDWVYPRYNPGPNAVRECTATYVQEYRPSGTVITPRMNCFWRRG
jgi:hypothetical protein